MQVLQLRRWARAEPWLAAACIALVLALQIVAIYGQSLSGDGAYHLLAGHQALRWGSNNLNLEHPPLVKLAVALPLLAEDEPLAPPVTVDRALAAANELYARGELIRRATVHGRWVALVVFVLPFLAAVFLLGRRTGGRRTGVVLVLTVALSLSVLPYLTLLQTDTAIALAYLLVLLAAIRQVERPSLARAAVLGLASGFALTVKLSAVLLGPTVLIALLLRPPGRLRHLLLAAAVTVATVELVYLAANRDYDPELGRATIRTYAANRGTLAVDDALRPLEPALLAIERYDPRLAQWLTGFLGVRIQSAIGVYPSYAFGEVRSQGRWWYFPVVFLVKTPLAVLLAMAVAGAAALRSRRRRLIRGDAQTREAFLLLAVTVGVYLAAAVSSSYNLSVRHLLPVVPILYLPLARWLASRPLRSALVIGVLVVESLALAPLWMSATNTWWLGPANPTRFALGAGNLEYRQNFRQLARVAERRRLEPLVVLYPALPDAVLQTDLPRARMGRPGEPIEPGWYAVNVTVEQFVPALLAAKPGAVYNFAELRRAAELWEPYWQEVVLRGEDHGWVAGTFHLYRID